MRNTSFEQKCTQVKDTKFMNIVVRPSPHKCKSYHKNRTPKPSLATFHVNQSTT